MAQPAAPPPSPSTMGSPTTTQRCCHCSSAWVGGRHPHAPWADILTVSQLQSLHGAGVEIGAHTVTHPDLTALPAEQATAELAECRRTLEDILDAAVTVAAYPFGKADASTL